MFATIYELYELEGQEKLDNDEEMIGRGVKKKDLEMYIDNDAYYMQDEMEQEKERDPHNRIFCNVHTTAVQSSKHTHRVHARSFSINCDGVEMFESGTNVTEHDRVETIAMGINHQKVNALILNCDEVEMFESGTNATEHDRIETISKSINHQKVNALRGIEDMNENNFFLLSEADIVCEYEYDATINNAKDGAIDGNFMRNEFYFEEDSTYE